MTMKLGVEKGGKVDERKSKWVDVERRLIGLWMPSIRQITVIIWMDPASQHRCPSVPLSVCPSRDVID